MFTIKQPPNIVYGKNSASEYNFPKNSLLITSSGAKNRNWFSYINFEPSLIYDQVEPNPSIETVNKIIEIFQKKDFTTVVGLGGGSVLDVAKYVAYKLKKQKILIPTNFGSGSEVTRISVLKVNGLKKSFHDDQLFADVAIVDSNFAEIMNTETLKNSVIDACAQCTEAYDSKLSNPYTKFLCSTAFDILEDAILNKNPEKLALGSMISGLGFGNSSTTFGHALSYVFSNEGISHGHALAFTTIAAHNFNKSQFYLRFKNLVKVLNFEKISINQNLDNASELILSDRKHLDNNPLEVSKNDIIDILKQINNQNSV
jgi:succinate semialdehyde reductase|tara:strand:- start:195 stop:1139 length:945 start_codon:yes stop_codon:yes gene_type:complete